MDKELLIAVLTVLAYSGLAAGLVNRLTRSRADLREESRAIIKNNLELLESMGKARETLETPERRAEFQQMHDRLMAETTARIEELNGIEDIELKDPSERYILLPPPRTAWGALMSLIFGMAVYFSVGALVLIFFFLFRQELNVFDNPDDQIWTIKVVGVSFALGLLAFIARFAAYRSFKAYLDRRREAGRAARSV